MNPAFKLFKLAAVVSVFLTHHSFIFITYRDKNRRAKRLATSASNYCKLVCKALSIKIESDVEVGDTEKRLILSNHMSYVDVFCLSSLYPTLYVTSVEIKETPVLGHICQLAGCLFTERRRKKRTQSTLNDEIKSMEAYLSSGVSITLFPEGTSTDGSAILPFKTSLIQSSFGGETLIVPLAIKYKNRDKVCWYGDMTFFPHLMELIKIPEIHVRITKAALIAPKDVEDRKDVGVKARQLIADLYFSEV